MREGVELWRRAVALTRQMPAVHAHPCTHCSLAIHSSARMAFNSMEMEVFEQLKSLAEDCTGIKALVAMMMDENATLVSCVCEGDVRMIEGVRDENDECARCAGGGVRFGCSAAAVGTYPELATYP